MISFMLLIIAAIVLVAICAVAIGAAVSIFSGLAVVLIPIAIVLVGIWLFKAFVNFVL